MFFKEFIKNAFFPKFCFGCSRPGTYLCYKCKNKLYLVRKDFCPYCGSESFFGLTHPGCRRTAGLAGLLSIYYYNSVLKKIIKNIKYKLASDVINDFLHSIPNSRLEELIFYKKLSKDIKILPVPLYKQRHRKRGFNQSEELAKFFSKFLDLPIADNIVIRVKNTKPQVELDTKEKRFKNISGAFSLEDDVPKSKVENKDFVIFDDVWTTGSTIKEIARVLKKNQARNVYALTIAR